MADLRDIYQKRSEQVLKGYLYCLLGIEDALSVVEDPNKYAKLCKERLQYIYAAFGHAAVCDFKVGVRFDDLVQCPEFYIQLPTGEVHWYGEPDDTTSNCDDEEKLRRVKEYIKDFTFQ